MERSDDDGCLPFLNTKIKIIRGQKKHVWYKKPASANILIHSRSAHPNFIKANVVRNFLRTKDKLRSATDPNVEREVARILDTNGYNAYPITT
ncbi:hypothetical protein Y032_0157g3192 [Ancylostoma ceylanicum]|uniref:Helix-turn-helix domain-containing protein n=1 Tax=Ancylostoma ceylanicum TaxID=53326 RepID=A0A016SY49_9BILA|nr:hypothetical protein Y032_0157g3192 [Ancylostoma ceylanicum]